MASSIVDSGRRKLKENRPADECWTLPCHVQIPDRGKNTATSVCNNLYTSRVD